MLIAVVSGCASDQQQLQGEVDKQDSNQNQAEGNNIGDKTLPPSKDQGNGAASMTKGSPGGQQINNAADENFAANGALQQTAPAGNGQNLTAQDASGAANSGGDNSGAMVNSASETGGMNQGSNLLQGNGNPMANAPSGGELGDASSQEGSAPAQADAEKSDQAVALQQKPADPQAAGQLPQTPASALVVPAPMMGGVVMYVLPGGAPIYDQPSGKVVGNLEQGDHPLVLIGQ